MMGRGGDLGVFCGREGIWCGGRIGGFLVARGTLCRWLCPTCWTSCWRTISRTMKERVSDCDTVSKYSALISIKWYQVKKDKRAAE